MGALSHIRVLDLSRILAGPWAGQLLADLGAEVIKVERPGRGDDTRGWGPPYLKDGDGRDSRDAAYFLTANRNKQSLAIDIASAEGQALIRRLVAECDVLLENYKVDGLKKYGLDYDSLKELNPGLIYCSITGFGQTGPYRKRAGYDFLIQAMSGLMSITGEPDGMPGGGPQKVGVALTDVLTGMYAATAVLAALAHRGQTGEGQYIDLALLDVQVACLANQALNYRSSGQVPQRLGNAHPNIVPYQVFASADGHIILAVGNDDQFARCCELLGHAEWAADRRFASNAARVVHRELLIPLLAEQLAGQPSSYWLQVMEAAGVPCGPINRIDQVFADPQVQARQMAVDLPHASGGTAPLVANPIRMSRTPVEYRQAPPQLGADTREVLGRWLGLTAQDLQPLVEQGVLQCADR
ncbi:CaiB/BaiF CoA transferase family protein [Marinobacterium arenosum]|uniref:CaiB/BaiF CoA transferase family protein n=1 Tax=Marinobacterium arenosum TaxID=2862496 RepID=UPI001C98251F|nr:CaiB/BaiF CoA-transferase family protein [Marinobacterium arenosum]MBY4677308.1 CoA transferase [Marinobacterium arenosum]